VRVLVTWTAIELSRPQATSPWTPDGAVHAQAGQSGAGTAEVPSVGGRWWSVLATWRDDCAQQAAVPPAAEDVRAAWHVVLAPASYRGDAVLAGGAQPFAALPRRGKVSGAAAVITLAGLGPDADRTGEFFERFVALGTAVRDARGHRAALVQAPGDGALLTFSAWDSLRDAVTWAYHRPEHARAVARQEEHPLLASTGFLRCAVVSSSGTLLGTDPLAGLTGTPVVPEEPA
jgi:heme-degrading monooxygenase HmoA